MKTIALASLVLSCGCELFFDDGESTPPPPEPTTMDGTWSLDRSIASIDPIPPTTMPCTQGFTTGHQPSTMTIVRDVVATDFGMPLQHVTWGGAHALTFEAQEYWNTVGWNDLVTLRYTFDQVEPDTLHGTITVRPPLGWPTGTCDYRYITVSRRTE